MAGSPSPMNTGSTRSRKRCEACRVQKKACTPVNRVWTKGERCDRCKHLGLPCGPNITSKEQKKGFPRLPRRDVGNQGKHETSLSSLQPSQPTFDALDNEARYGILNYSEDATPNFIWPSPPTLEQNPTQSYESMSEHPLRTGSHKILNDNQGATRYLMDWSPTTTFEEDGTQFDGYISKELSTGLEEGGFKEKELKENEIFDLLRELGLRVKEWQYYQSGLLKSQDADQDLWRSMLQIWQVHVLKEIRLVADKVESFADEADCNGRRCQAHMAYTRLIDKLDQIGDHARRRSVLSKLAKFYMRNDDYTQAGETLQTLFMQDRVAGSDQDEWKSMLAEFYTKIALGISGLSREAEQYVGAEFGNPSLNLETPCPAFHLAIQDKAPAEVMSIILSRQGPEDSLDVLRRPSIHMAIELDRQDIVKELVQKMPTSVRAQDSLGRTPLQLAVQLPCEHRTSSQYSRTTMCPRASLCKILLSAGADRNARNDVGCTTLTSAARAGCSFICKDLLFGRYRTEAADINPILSYKQSTPLQAAAEEGQDDVVDILLKAGAKASEIRHNGTTAHGLAKERGHHGIVHRLEQALEEERVVQNPPFNLIAINPFMGGG